MIKESQLQQMFDLVKINKSKLHEALRNVGKKISQDPKKWTPERPTIGCCSAVSAMVYCYHDIPQDIIPIYLKTEDGSHWVLGLPIQGGEITSFQRDGYFVANIGVGKGKKTPHVIIDLTADQTDGDFDYDAGSRKAFMAMGGCPSKKTQTMAAAFGYIPTEFRRVGNQATWGQ